MAVKTCLYATLDYIHVGQTCTPENGIRSKLLKMYLTDCVCVKRYSYRMPIRNDRQVAVSAMIAKLLCHAAVFTASLHVLATPEVDQMIFTSWSSHKVF
jgi:hypothetical protein